MKDDTISRRAAIDAVDGVPWYHQNKNGEMVHGANDDEHQAWYKAEDIYKTIESVPPAQPSVSKEEMVGDTISRQAAIDALNEYFVRIGKLKRGGLTDGEKAISLDTFGVIKTLPSAQPGEDIRAMCGECDVWNQYAKMRCHVHLSNIFAEKIQ